MRIFYENRSKLKGGGNGSEDLHIFTWDRAKKKSSELDLYDETSKIEISISVKVFDEKTAENDQNCYVAKKTHSFQTIKDIDLKF